MSKYTEENPYNLTSKQLSFCEMYLFHEDCRFNGTKSAKMAGFSEKSARQQSVRILTNVNVIKHLAYLEDKFKTELNKRTAVDAAEVLAKIINKEYGLEYSPVNIVAALELEAKLHDRFPKQKLPIHGPEGEPLEVSQETRVLFLLPGERPLDPPPGEEKPQQQEVKPEKKENNEVSNLILETLKQKGVRHGNKESQLQK